MDKPLSLTYDELLVEAEYMLEMLIKDTRTPPNPSQRGGVILFWLRLAWKTSPAEEQLREDYMKLSLLAGLEPPADVL
ncbi:hypothetical protein [Kosakonia cowanii]